MVFLDVGVGRSSLDRPLSFGLRRSMPQWLSAGIGSHQRSPTEWSNRSSPALPLKQLGRSGRAIQTAVRMLIRQQFAVAAEAGALYRP